MVRLQSKCAVKLTQPRRHARGFTCMLEAGLREPQTKCDLWSCESLNVLLLWLPDMAAEAWSIDCLVRRSSKKVWKNGGDRRRSLTLQDGGGLHFLCGRAPSRGEVIGRGKRCMRFPFVWESFIETVVGGILVQGGRLEEALEKLLNLEKQTRTVSQLPCQAVLICGECSVCSLRRQSLGQQYRLNLWLFRGRTTQILPCMLCRSGNSSSIADDEILNGRTEKHKPSDGVRQETRENTHCFFPFYVFVYSEGIRFPSVYLHTYTQHTPSSLVIHHNLPQPPRVYFHLIVFLFLPSHSHTQHHLCTRTHPLVDLGARVHACSV